MWRSYRPSCVAAATGRCRAQWCHRHVGVYNALEDEPTGKAKNGNNTLKDVKMLCAAKRN